MATVYEIIKGINQAAANVYDGSHDKRFVVDGEDKVVGLKREEGCPINDSRVIDGFKVRIAGPKLIVTYQSELPIKSFHNVKLDSEIEQTYADIVKFLKKEYKKITGNTLALKADGPCDILLQNMSRIRTWCQCKKVYTIGGIKDVEAVGENSPGTAEEKLRAAVEKWLQTGKPKYSGAKKASNAKV
tara:strand:+ start:3375 stop:3935 length:561 start_codon:yes stop_codon:yes gene_type:complete